jgi:hypothetical protein
LSLVCDNPFVLSCHTHLLHPTLLRFRESSMFFVNMCKLAF